MTIITIPTGVELNVTVVVDEQLVLHKNSVGELELVQFLREALAKRLDDRNGKQLKKRIKAWTLK